jgi:hypothetical protein
MDGADDRRRGCSVLCPCIESVRSGPVSSPIVESAPSERLDHLVLTGVATVYFCSTDSAGQGVVIGSAWRCTSCQVPLVSRSSSVSFRASKEDEILIWIRDYKGSRAPWLLLKFLMERDSCSLITQKQLLDFVGGGNCDGSREQISRLRTPLSSRALGNFDAVWSDPKPAGSTSL